MATKCKPYLGVYRIKTLGDGWRIPHRQPGTLEPSGLQQLANVVFAAWPFWPQTNSVKLSFSEGVEFVFVVPEEWSDEWVAEQLDGVRKKLCEAFPRPARDAA